MTVDNIECIRDIDSGNVLLPTELTEGSIYELCIRTNTRVAKIEDTYIKKVSLLSKIVMYVPDSVNGNTYEIIVKLEISGNPEWLSKLSLNDYISTTCTLTKMQSNNNNYELQFTII